MKGFGKIAEHISFDGNRSSGARGGRGVAVMSSLMVLVLSVGVAVGPEAKGQRVLRPFDYQGVTLDDGPMR